jgi:hypothetical protein
MGILQVLAHGHSRGSRFSWLQVPRRGILQVLAHLHSPGSSAWHSRGSRFLWLQVQLAFSRFSHMAFSRISRICILQDLWHTHSRGSKFSWLQDGHSRGSRTWALPWLQVPFSWLQVQLAFSRFSWQQVPFSWQQVQLAFSRFSLMGILQVVAHADSPGCSAYGFSCLQVLVGPGGILVGPAWAFSRF